MNKRIAVAVEEDGVNEIIAGHFAKCSKFNVCEFDEQNNIVKKEAYINPLTGDHGGACQLPGYIKQFNVTAIIAGGMGQKAVSNFLQFGIDVITAPGLQYEEALNLYIKGKISGYEVCKHEHGHGENHNCQHS
jgi:predicted Fe-Mo cluster-binding NifX family protein